VIGLVLAGLLKATLALSSVAWAFLVAEGNYVIALIEIPLLALLLYATLLHSDGHQGKRAEGRT
jgi:hypothetical protein